jgi:transposase
MTMPTDDHMSKAGVASARRIEVFTGAGRRREWTADQKAAIVAESYAGSSSVCDVARRHGLTPTQLFTWRRAARRPQAASAEERPEFVPAMLEAPIDATKQERSRVDAEPLIGFDLDGASIWVCPGADAGMVTAIIRALKAPK